MKRLTLLMGPPGCGKSVAARRLMADGALRITGDDVFFAITDRKHSDWLAHGVMDAVNGAMDHLLQDLLSRGLDVVVDRTHLSRGKRANVLKWAKAADYEIDGLLWLNFEQAQGRNTARQGRDRVPESIWKKMADGYEHPTLKEGFTRLKTVVDAQGQILDPIAQK